MPQDHLFLENIFDELALEITPKRHQPDLVCERYVDGIFCILKKGFTEELFHHLNRARLTIKFTMEQKEELRTLSFTLLRRRDDSSLDTFVYRKPMHMNRYLHFKSHNATHEKRYVDMWEERNSLVLTACTCTAVFALFQ